MNQITVRLLSLFLAPIPPPGLLGKAMQLPIFQAINQTKPTHFKSQKDPGKVLVNQGMTFHIQGASPPASISAFFSGSSAQHIQTDTD